MVDFNDKVKQIEKEHNLSHYETLQRFMFERLLERISVSKYKENFILKGGLLLSAMFGIDNRTTKDIDTTITGIDVSKDEVSKVLNEIFLIDIKDNVKFKIIDITDIREDDMYGGNKYHIEGKYKNLKINFEIDVSTGDKVTPRSLDYKYSLLFENRKININSYNIETIFSEKIETILRRGTFNSRMKDYYDVYYILTNLNDKINFNNFSRAINNTFKNRDSFEYLNDSKQILSEIEKSDKLEELWNKYSQKYKYANNIKFKTIIKKINNLLKEYNKVDY